MRFANKRRVAAPGPLDDDPLSGVANLFDISVALIVALLVAMFGMFSGTSALDPHAIVTTVIQTKTGGVEMITRDKSGVTIRKSSNQQASGNGTRLGVAYQLSTGEVVYVPEHK